MDVWLEGRKVRLEPQRALGKGGEADVYDLGDGRALKVFKRPEHPDYQGLAPEQAARLRDQLAQLREQAFGALVHDNIVPLDSARKPGGSR